MILRNREEREQMHVDQLWGSYKNGPRFTWYELRVKLILSTKEQISMYVYRYMTS